MFSVQNDSNWRLMRPRHQNGQVLRSGSQWVLKFYQDALVDGEVKRQRVTRLLAPTSDYKTERDVRTGLAEKISTILSPVNAQHQTVSMSLGDFIRYRYFPRLEFRLTMPAGNELHIEPSTVKGYLDIFKVHVEQNPIAKIRLQAFTSRHRQPFLESLPQKLSHQTHLRIKNFLRGVFTW